MAVRRAGKRCGIVRVAGAYSLRTFERGLEFRKAVLGADFVENAISSADDFEVFLQVAIYCGVPAGVDSFRTAREVFGEIDGKKWGRLARQPLGGIHTMRRL